MLPSLEHFQHGKIFNAVIAVKSDANLVVELVDKKAPISQFIAIIRGYSNITELTPEIMHEIIDSIQVHAPDKSSGHRKQMVDIRFRFDVIRVSAIPDIRDYDSKRKLRSA